MKDIFWGASHQDDGKQIDVTSLVPGISIGIPAGTAFQYRNVSNAELKFICLAMKHGLCPICQMQPARSNCRNVI